MKINRTLKFILPLILVAGCIALLIYLVTWQPAESAQAYTPYVVTKKDVQQTIQVTGLVITKLVDKEETKLVQWYVSEDQVNDIAIDQEATLDITALDNSTTGKIDFISSEPRLTGNTTEYEVLVKFNDEPEHLLNGMHADVTVVLETKNNVLAVPNDSLIEVNDEYSVNIIHEQRRIYSKSLNIDKTVQNLEPTNVTIGLLGDDYTEITSGLSENEVISAN
ncbi:MAG: HlyD family efflux transporter periplasmic adaptor subunit [Patescibacteria group bacterium]|jgi:HlyD family secretion protein